MTAIRMEVGRAAKLWQWGSAAVLGLSAVMLALRSFLAARVPLTGDEAYYWEWSRRPALGYHDHPPIVAWIIAAFDGGAHNVYLVRIGFVLCGLLAGLVLAALTTRIAKDRAAGVIAVTLFSLAPMLSVAFGTATPDGPFLLFWIVALYCALRALDRAGTRWWVALGAAVGAAMLSRMLGVALVVGIIGMLLLNRQYRVQLRSPGPWLGALTLTLILAPWIAWNVGHHWESFGFTLSRAAPTGGVSISGPLALVGLLAAALSPGILVASAWPFFRGIDFRQTWVQVIAWTAVPLIAGLIALSAFHTIEVYWLLAPSVSLMVAAAIALARTRPSKMTWAVMLAPAVVELAVLLTYAKSPQSIYELARMAGARAPSQGLYESFAYPALSRELRSKASAAHAWVVTDGYGLSSVMDFYGDVPPVVVGANPQGRESRRWYDAAAVPPTIFFVDRDPSTKRGVKKLLSEACPRLRPDVMLRYLVANQAPVTFYVSKCDGITRVAFLKLARGRTWLLPAHQ